MRHVIRMPTSIYDRAKAHLLGGRGERYGFFLAGVQRGPRRTSLLIRDFVPVPDNAVVFTDEGFELPPSAWLPARNRAHAENAALVEAHSHPLGPALFSGTDEEWGATFATYMLDDLPGRPYAATVWSGERLDGHVWLPGAQGWAQVNELTVVGPKLTRIPTNGLKSADFERPDEAPYRRYARQLPAIGKAGLEALRAIRVGIVGLGGLGSVSAVQLAYVGVRQFVLADRDRVDETSLNRLLGAGPADERMLKTAVLGREIRRIVGPDWCDIQIVGDLRSVEAIDALREVDILVGAVDNDAARLILNEIAVGYLIPFFDLGVGIEVGDGVVTEAGGRVIFVHPDGPCLSCAKAYSPRVAAEELMDPGDLESARARGYVSGANEPSPSVITLNAVVAGLGMTEFLAFVTGFRPALEGLYYDMLQGGVAVTKFHRDPRCVVCAYRGRGDDIRLERYLPKVEAPA